MAGEAHTPGPWSFNNGSMTGAVWARKEFVASVYPSAPEDWDGFSDFAGLEEMRANARLIAAAPDLLAAAILAEDIIDDFLGHLSPEEQIACTDDPKAAAALKALRAAIARAQAGEGGQ